VPVTRDSTPIVTARGLAIGYGEHPVVRGLDLDLRSGDVLTVLGANGSGKSTLIRGVLGLASLMAGRLELFGTPADRFTERWRIGYVPQRHTVVGGVPSTVREVVASGRLSRKGWFSRLNAADRAAVDRAVDVVGLAEKAGSNVAELSGGQQRRVLIARALAGQPDVLVLDEPTAGVDTANQAILADTLARLVEAGTTLLLVAHELGPLEPLVTRAVVMRGGLKVYDGAPAREVLLPFTGADHASDVHGEAPVDGLGLPGEVL
jgi:zinc transport system ATP-binding protein